MLAAALYTDRYGLTRIDPNHPDDAPKGTTADWYPWFKEKISGVPFVIAVLSPELNAVTPVAYGGVGLIFEILSFWNQEDSDLTAKLIPILVDCEARDLKVAPGSYEQLQDIVAPLIERCDPITVNSADLSSPSTSRRLVESVARRLGVDRKGSEP